MELPAPNIKKAFQITDHRQKRIYEKLWQVGQNTPRFYRDACRIKYSEPQFDTATNLIGHLLREIESSLRDVMLPQDFIKPKETKEGHKCEVEEIIRVYGIPKNEGGDIWLELANGKSKRSLHSWAHRNDLSQPRIIDKSFEELWEGMQTLLDAVLSRLEVNYAQYIPMLDAIIKKPTIKESDVNLLKKKIPNSNVLLIYFFDHIEDPQWLPILKDAGFFTYAFEPITREDGNPGYPYWPQVVFLKKMARITDCQDLITEICSMVETENMRVWADVIDISLELPAKKTVFLVQKFINWIGMIQSWLLPSRYGKLISHLANNGYGKDAIAVAKALLQITPNPKEPVTVPVGNKDAIIPQDPQALFDDHEYERVLKEDFPSLLPVVGEEAIELLCNLLTDAIALRHPGRIGPQDGSYIWQSSIEDHGENYRHGVKSILVWAVRDNCERYIKDDGKRLESVVSSLRKRKYFVFQRIALYLIRVFAKYSPEQVTATLLDKTIFDNRSLLHEYFLLAKEQFTNLSAKNQDILLSWIDKGIDMEIYKKMCKQNKFVYTQENCERYIKKWQLDRLSPIKDSLPIQRKERYESYVKEIGKPDDLVFMTSTTTGGSWGPTSPKNSQELKAMPMSALVSYLKDWKPSKEMDGNSEEGLGREIMELVKADPLTFSKNADKFIGLRTTYVRNLLRGFWEVINQSGQIDWEHVLILCNWIVKQPKKENEEDEGKYSWNSDPGWSWSFNTIAEVFQAGFKEDKKNDTSEMPWEYREKAWQILEVLTHDSDPNPKNEAKHLEGSDPASLSFNTTRGDAMHAVIDYAVWCKRHLKKESKGFEEMPEVKKVLEDHLDTTKDSSVIIRSIYGEQLARLTYLDESWVKENINNIFPKAEKEHDLWSAAWSSYILFCRPYHTVYDFMKEEYILALNQLGRIKTKKRFSTDVDERLIEHLMVLYWTGKITLENEVLKQFYTIAPEDLKYAALDFIGRTFHGVKEKIQPEIIERLQKLWKDRLAVVKNSHTITSKEVDGFGWWFTANIFPEEWAMEQLIEALKLAEKLYPDVEVIEKLATLVTIMPAQVIDALILIVATDKEGWRILSSKETIRKIIETILQINNPQAVEKIQELISILITKGYAEEYKNLL